MLEAGTTINRSNAVRRFQASTGKGANAPYKPSPHAPQPSDDDANSWYVNVGPDAFNGAYVRATGGTTWHWTGFADRLRPTDFTMKTTYGVGFDWPIGYDELVPWYREAETEWGVSGYPEDAELWGTPRTEPFPLDGIPATYMDLQVKAAAAKLGLTVGRFTHARNSIEHDGRPACCGNNTCQPICPIQAKYDATVHVAKAVKAGAQLVEDLFAAAQMPLQFDRAGVALAAHDLQAGQFVVQQRRDAPKAGGLLGVPDLGLQAGQGGGQLRDGGAIRREEVVASRQQIAAHPGGRLGDLRVQALDVGLRLHGAQHVGGGGGCFALQRIAGGGGTQ